MVMRGGREKGRFESRYFMAMKEVSFVKVT
jgi:hypothetical protein